MKQGHPNSPTDQWPKAELQAKANLDRPNLVNLPMHRQKYIGFFNAINAFNFFNAIRFNNKLRGFEDFLRQLILHMLMSKNGTLIGNCFPIISPQTQLPCQHPWP